MCARKLGGALQGPWHRGMLRGILWRQISRPGNRLSTIRQVEGSSSVVPVRSDLTPSGATAHQPLPRHSWLRKQPFMRTHAGILAATLALTIFLTSLILERPRTGMIRGTSLPDGAVESPADRALEADASALPEILGAKCGVQGLVARGWRFYEAGNGDGAIELLKSALAADAEDRSALAALGVVCYASRRYSEAEEYLTRLLARNKDADPGYRARLAMSQLRQRKFGPALANLEAVLRLEPDNGGLHFVIGTIYSRLADRERALYHLEQAYQRLGFALLAHVSDANLDPLRDTPQFKRLVKKALADYRRLTAALPEQGEPVGSR